MTTSTSTSRLSSPSGKRGLAALLLSALLSSLVACGGGKIPPPPPPLRPKAEPAATNLAKNDTRTDCDPTNHNREELARTFDERSPDEAADLARQGVASLQAANKEGDRSLREDQIDKAVNFFVTALLADPYNVSATYNLAAAYARIKRVQCSLNLLERLFAMQEHHSRKVEVADSINRLLGRVGKNLDPDFNEMRADSRFRTMIANMCGNARDATDCVYGGPKR